MVAIPFAPEQLPRSEAELLHQRPPSHRDLAFPRRLLLPGERVLFETRPHLVYQSGWTVGVLILLLAASLALGLAALYTSITGIGPAPASAPAASGVGFLGAVFWSAMLGLVLRSRRSTAFALTDRRVLAVRGFLSSDFRFADWARVERMYVPGGTIGTLVFDLRPTGPDTGQSGTAHRTIVWDAIDWAPRTHLFAQTAFAVEAARAAAEARDSRQRTELLTQRVECAYCGNLVVPRRSDGGRTTCPRCSAPMGTRAVPPPTSLPSGSTRPDAELVPFLRPVVYLGRGAIDWYRSVPVVWGILLAALAGDLLLTGAGGAPPLLEVIPVTTLLVVSVPIAYLLWGQSIRKWGTVVRTLQGSVPSGSPWHAEVVRPLRLRLGIAIAGFVGAFVFPGLALAAEIELNSFGPPARDPFTLGEFAFGACLVGYCGAIVVGQMALVRSFARVGGGSGVPSIDETLRRGTAWATAGLAGGFWPVALLLAGIAWNVSPAVIAYLLLPAILAPVAVLVGVGMLLRGLDRWSDLAEHVLPGPGVAAGVGLFDRTSPDESPSGAAPPWADRVGWGKRRTRWALAAATVGVVACALLLGSGWLVPFLDRVPGVAGLGAAPTPPEPIVAQGALWEIPPAHYQAQPFPLHENGTVVGSFHATGPVDGYVMDSNAFNIWLIGGRDAPEFATGNVTTGEFEAPIVATDRYYVVVVNWNATVGVEVSWTTECQVDFPG